MESYTTRTTVCCCCAVPSATYHTCSQYKNVNTPSWCRQTRTEVSRTSPFSVLEHGSSTLYKPLCSRAVAAKPALPCSLARRSTGSTHVSKENMHSSLYTLSCVLGIFTLLKCGRINPRTSSETTSLSSKNVSAILRLRTNLGARAYRTSVLACSSTS